MRAQGYLAIGLLQLLPWAAASPVFAQDSSADASRRALISDAQSAGEHGDHARAIELANRAAQVRMTPSLRLFLAEESAEVRDWLQAYTNATQCRSEALADPTLPHRNRLLGRCARIEARAVSHVGFVTVRVRGEAPGLSVRIGGVELPAALWGVRYAVAASTVVVEAGPHARGSFRQELAVAEGQARDVEVVLTGAPVPTPAPVSVVDVPRALAPPATATVASPPVLARPIPTTPRGPGVGPWVVVGAGGLALGGAVALYGLTSSLIADRDAACPTVECDAASASNTADSDARTLATAGNIALGVGSAAVVGGLAWWLFTRPATRAPVAAWIAPHGRGLNFGLGGTF